MFGLTLSEQFHHQQKLVEGSLALLLCTPSGFPFQNSWQVHEPLYSGSLPTPGSALVCQLISNVHRT